MSQLETNTTGLQALLDMVNALPNAGSGGGESSGYQVATGEFSVETSVTEASTVAATVSGLSFKPQIVWVIRLGNASQSTGTTNKNKYIYYGSMYDNGNIINKYYGMAGSTSLVTIGQESTNKWYSIKITDDGFTIGRGASSSTTVTYTVSSTYPYRYIAIG